MSSAADVFWWLPATLQGIWHALDSMWITSSVSVLTVIVAVALLSILIRSLINKG